MKKNKGIELYCKDEEILGESWIDDEFDECSEEWEEMSYNTIDKTPIKKRIKRGY